MSSTSAAASYLRMQRAQPSAAVKALMACSGRGSPRASQMKNRKWGMSVPGSFSSFGSNSLVCESYPGIGEPRFTRVKMVRFPPRVRARRPHGLLIVVCRLRGMKALWHTVALVIVAAKHRVSIRLLTQRMLRTSGWPAGETKIEDKLEGGQEDEQEEDICSGHPVIMVRRALNHVE